MSNLLAPVVNIASATPRIAPLNLGEESPGDAKVDLEPVPLADIPTLPPMSSASAAFPNLLKPLYETVPVEALSPREERSFDLPEDHPEGSKADSSESAKQEDNQHKLASNLATAAATSDLPSAIEHIVQSGLTPSAEALLDAVQESLIGAMRDEGTSPSLERESISPIPSALEPTSAHAPEASDASDATLASSTLDDIHTQVKADEAEAPVLDEAEAPLPLFKTLPWTRWHLNHPNQALKAKQIHTKTSIDDAAPPREA
ncbi:hypothetical protein BKA70DRAFT_371697 [Coprinopsis sp. MPI-PUGE-AT-0042]|nr:hypothetical protein BKA70DRAFT_371697 [Coprinopsis sp. MPI-PUGE-AT-0042]